MLLSLLIEHQGQAGQLLAQVAARESERDCLTGQLTAHIAAAARSEQEIFRQFAAQQEKIVAPIGQSANDKMAAESAEQRRKIESLIDQVAERQRAIETLQSSRLFRVLHSYWRARQMVRRAWQVAQTALRGLSAYSH